MEPDGLGDGAVKAYPAHRAPGHRGFFVHLRNRLSQQCALLDAGCMAVRRTDKKPVSGNPKCSWGMDHDCINNDCEAMSTGCYLQLMNY